MMTATEMLLPRMPNVLRTTSVYATKAPSGLHVE